jgi:hypothetical protein
VARKKSRRARKRARPTRHKPPARKTPIAKKPPPSKPRTRKTVDFASEYRYVYADLKRIALTAVAMLAVLIILSFVIR